MVKLPFNVSARTARLIGRENVANADGAVIELVKNGYDADAKKVVIIFAEDGDLYVVDNGHGMTESIIKDIWMTIGTDHKEIDPFSPQKRVKSGAKGIGRFALDRLGEKVEMLTLSKDQEVGFSWKADWSAFEKKDTNVSDVKATLEEVLQLDLLKYLPDFYQEFEEIRRIDLSSQGTVLRISNLRDSWTEQSLDELYRNLESLVPGTDSEAFSIDLHSFAYQNKYGSVKPLLNEDFDYRITATYSSENKSISAKVERNEFDLVALEKKFGEVFLDPLMKKYPYTLDVFKKGFFEQIFEVNELINGFSDSNNLLNNLGDFSFSLTFAKNSAPNKEDLQKYPYKNFEYASRKEWLEKFRGVKVFRDNFRVRPYGEKGEDWLRLGERQALSPAGPGQGLNGYRVRPNQITGAVYISRIHNLSFQDKSSREGIQENDTFYLFKNLLISIISIIERDRNTVFYCLSELYKRTDEAERIKSEAREAATRIKKGSKQPAGSASQTTNEDAEKIVKALDVLESEIEEKHEEIKILRSLASAGLITAAVAHELRGLENILATRNKDLKNLIEPYIKEEDLKDVKDAFNPYVLLAEMERTDKNLQEWLNYALMPLKRDKRKRATVFLGEYFNHLGDTWRNLLAERKIDLVVDEIDDSYRVKSFIIDLDTIFNNLIINSIESFSRKRDNSKRQIKISCTYKYDKYHVIYSDNGSGLDESFKNNPATIFLPQTTTKLDSLGNVIGTGMGMYLVKNAVEENGGSVDILRNNSGFSILISLLS
ncbi:MAG: hypothetical protein ACD_37C00436G0001 [uncultured bacterium]|nr:MAG: hypothetical protein ACD_37C00436G0001 [uncultured bacterium]